MALNRPEWHKYMQTLNSSETSDLSLHLKLTKLSADRVITDSEFHTVAAATVKSREATEVSTSGH